MNIATERDRVHDLRPVESVAVIIVNWNSGPHLKACIDALSHQSVPITKILIVDNASVDDSIQRLVVPLPSAIEVMHMDANVGFAAANNQGLERIGGMDWVALLNPDAFPEAKWLEQLLVAASNSPEYHCFSSCQVMAQHPKVLDGAGDEYHVSGLHWRRGYGTAREERVDVDEVFGACAAAALYRVSALRAIGGFDDNFFCYAEDVDVAFRLRLKGYRCLYVPTAVVRHIGSAMTGKRSAFTIYHGHRNLVWVYFKNMPALLFWMYLPQHLLLNLMAILWFTLRGQGRVIIKAKWDAIKGLPRILRQRTEIQKSRTVTWRGLRRVMVGGVLTPYRRRAATSGRV